MVSNIRMRFPENRRKALTLSYDDGVEQDIQLVEIMDKYGLKGTFNLNAGLYAPEGTTYPAGRVHRRMTRSQCIEAFKNHEVATHGYTHPWPEKINSATVCYEIIKDREALELTDKSAMWHHGGKNDLCFGAAEFLELADKLV